MTDFALVDSVTPFVKSEKFLSLIMGPVGSTKTTAGIAKVAYHAERMAQCIDGVRRSRCIWIRNTREQLRDTSIPDFLKWYPENEFGTFAKTEYRYVLKWLAADDTPVECEVMFRGLDDANDVRRLLSLQASFAVFEEFRETNKDVFEVMQTRVGRYPDGTMVPHREEWGVDKNGVPIQGCVTDDGSPNKHVWGMSNPPDDDTYFERLIQDPPDNLDVFIQPSGMSPEADWLHFLPTDYYDNMAQGKSQDFVDVYVHAKFGKSLSGKPVFRCFDKSTHVAKGKLNIISGSTLVIGVDAGLNPSAVITQQTFDGRVLAHDAITGLESGMGALRFCREMLKPLLSNKYRGMDTIIIIDPAAFQRGQTDEKTVADIYRSEGFLVKPAKTNAITARLAAGEAFMTRTINGNSGLLIAPEATLLIETLRSKYRYKINTKGEMDDKPDKSHPWSDIADAFTYACLAHDGGAMSGGRAMTQRREIKPAPHRWA